MTTQTNHPGMTRARSVSTARKPAATTSAAGTRKIAGESAESEVSARSATSKNSVFTGPGQSAVTDTPVSRSSARRASENLVT